MGPLLQVSGSLQVLEKQCKMQALKDASLWVSLTNVWPHNLTKLLVSEREPREAQHTELHMESCLPSENSMGEDSFYPTTEKQWLKWASHLQLSMDFQCTAALRKALSAFRPSARSCGHHPGGKQAGRSPFQVCIWRRWWKNTQFFFWKRCLHFRSPDKV